MYNSQIKLLQCPYCENTFRIGSICEINNNRIIYGTIVCQCEEFPIVEKILILDKIKAKLITQNINDKQLRKALINTIIPDQGKLNKIYKIILKYFLVKKALKNKKYAKTVFSFIKNRSEANYFINRKKEYDSLLFFIPILLKSDSKKPSIWVNYGAGLLNFYTQIHQLFNKKIIFLSIEQSFLSLFLSNYQDSNNSKVIKICADSSIGRINRYKADISTLIDAIPFVEKQKEQIRILESSTKDDGLIFLSGIVQHMYLPIKSWCFPIHPKVIQSFFKRSSIILDEIKLIKQFKNNDINISKTISNENYDHSKYSLLCINNKHTYKMKKQLKLNDSLLSEANYFWVNRYPTFKNRCY